MNHSTARIETDRASIYLQQLCKHFAHKLPVSFTPAQGQITFSVGVCRLEANNGILTLKADAEDTDRLTQLQSVVDKHLQRFAFRAPLAIEWFAAEAV